MRFLLVIILLFNSINIFAQNENNSIGEKSVLLRNLRFNVQSDVLQTLVLIDSSGKNDHFTENSFSLGFELITQSKEHLIYGIGAMYQFPSSSETIRGKIGAIPIYALIDYPLIRSEQFPVHLSIRFGYAFLTTKEGIDKSEDGIYHSLGFTMMISENFLMKLMYSHNYGKIKIDSDEYSLRRKYLNIGIIFKF